MKKVIVALATAAVLGGAWSTAHAATRTAWKWPFSNNSPFNRPIANGATYHDDANIRVNGIVVNMASYGRLVTKAASTDPLVNVTYESTYGNPGNCGQPMLSLPVSLRMVAGVSGTNPQTCSREGVLYAVEPDGRTGHSFLHFYRVNNTSAKASRHFKNANNDAISGEGWGKDGVRAGPSASGVSMGVCVLRAWELNLTGDQRFKHTLYFSKQYSCLRASPHYKWPATSADGCADSCYQGTLHLGELLAIPKTFDIHGQGWNADAVAVAWTMQNFGVYVLDGSGGNGTKLLAEQGCNATKIDNVKANITAILNQLRVVDNNTQSTPGGGTAWPAALYPPPTPVP